MRSIQNKKTNSCVERSWVKPKLQQMLFFEREPQLQWGNNLMAAVVLHIWQFSRCVYSTEPYAYAISYFHLAELLNICKLNEKKNPKNCKAKHLINTHSVYTNEIVWQEERRRNCHLIHASNNMRLIHGKVSRSASRLKSKHMNEVM